MNTISFPAVTVVLKSEDASDATRSLAGAVFSYGDALFEGEEAAVTSGATGSDGRITLANINGRPFYEGQQLFVTGTLQARINMMWFVLKYVYMRFCLRDIWS